MPQRRADVAAVVAVASAVGVSVEQMPQSARRVLNAALETPTRVTPSEAQFRRVHGTMMPWVSECCLSDGFWMWGEVLLGGREMGDPATFPHFHIFSLRLMDGGARRCKVRSSCI